MKIIDLCCGLGGATQYFREKGHDVFSVDIESKFKPDLLADVRSLEKDDFPFNPDFIWASPPCITNKRKQKISGTKPELRSKIPYEISKALYLALKINMNNRKYIKSPINPQKS